MKLFYTQNSPYARRPRIAARENGLRSAAVLEKETARAVRAYDALEALAGEFGDVLHLGTIAVAASLGNADWRHPGDRWREGRPTLTTWFEKMEQRASLVETKPVF